MKKNKHIKSRTKPTKLASAKTVPVVMGIEDREVMAGLIAQVGENARRGNRVALHKLAELLIDETLLMGFTAADRQFLLRRSLEALSQAQRYFTSFTLWSLLLSLGHPDLRKGSQKILRSLLENDHQDALAMLKKSLRTPGEIAVHAADIIAKFSGEINEEDYFYLGLRVLQSERHGPAFKLFVRDAKNGHKPALQALRALLWQKNERAEFNLVFARLQAALVLVAAPKMIDNEDLSGLREAAREAQGVQLRQIYEALETMVKRSDESPVVVQAFAGLLKDTFLGPVLGRGNILRKDAATSVLELDKKLAEKADLRRALAALVVLWSEDVEQTSAALLLLEPELLAGDECSIRAVLTRVSQRSKSLDSARLEGMTELLQGASHSGYALEVVTCMLDVMRAQAELSSAFYTALQLCALDLSWQAPVVPVLVQSLRERAHKGHQDGQDAQRVLQQVFANFESNKADEEPASPLVSERETATKRIVKVRRGMS